jgi:hypothetical protein
MKRLITLIHTLNYISAAKKNFHSEAIRQTGTSKWKLEWPKTGIIKDLSQRFIFRVKPTRDSIVKRFLRKNWELQAKKFKFVVVKCVRGVYI